MIRAQRRLEHARRRPTPRREESTDALFEALRVAYLRWVEHRGDKLDDVCPACSARIVVTARHGESDIAHALPFCASWFAFATLVGAHSPKVV